MKDLLKKILVPIKDVQEIRGVLLPIGMEYLQLVVTGPPGAGKSYYINQIGGWPNEGYIDLTRKNWWKNQTLIYRPREVHLGMPFKGFEEALTVFDKEWVESDPAPLLDTARIKIPRQAASFFQTNWINRYFFEFLLPSPEEIFERRQSRKHQGYFPVDAGLTLEMVGRQVLAYQEVALYLHRAGLNIAVRRSLQGPPFYIAEKGVAHVPQWSIPTHAPRPSLNSVKGWKQLLGIHRSTWFTITTEPQPVKEVSRVAHDGKSFEMLIGNQRFYFAPEISLGVKRRSIRKNWRVSEPHGCDSTEPSGFVRIQDGETVIIGRSNKIYAHILQFDSSVSMRHVGITNERGDLTFTPLNMDRPVQLVRFDDMDYRGRVKLERENAFHRIKQIFGGQIQQKPREEALQLLEKAIDCISHDPARESDRSGSGGGVILLNDDTIPVIVGDLHGQVDNLLKILSENCLLRHLENKAVTMVVLGDALHSEIAGEMEDMDSSILMIDLLCTLKLQFPESFYYIAGNHDSFSEDISKNGISQGVLLKNELFELRGRKYVDAMDLFFEKLPYIVSSKLFFACHAAPPLSRVSYEELVNISDNPALIREITRNRLQRPNYPGGYRKKDINTFRKSLGLAKGVPFIVGHTPMDPFSSVWKNVDAIKKHHIIYSAHQDGPTILQYIRGNFIPLSYPAEPLVKLLNDL
ncbi:metallophosphoesterase [Desulfogranum japonicum]|uniref:metallophosphoesterase n=1 Tax=Desulfogranum japonicum TaxID=231447 RepID=UPI000405B897|nr:metallophosphoesterase [Desulfogranum japonicum]